MVTSNFLRPTPGFGGAEKAASLIMTRPQFTVQNVPSAAVTPRHCVAQSALPYEHADFSLQSRLNHLLSPRRR
jgi:hypothetical protein